VTTRGAHPDQPLISGIFPDLVIDPSLSAVFFSQFYTCIPARILSKDGQGVRAITDVTINLDLNRGFFQFLNNNPLTFTVA